MKKLNLAIAMILGLTMVGCNDISNTMDKNTNDTKVEEKQEEWVNPVIRDGRYEEEKTEEQKAEEREKEEQKQKEVKEEEPKEETCTNCGEPISQCNCELSDHCDICGKTFREHPNHEGCYIMTCPVCGDYINDFGFCDRCEEAERICPICGDYLNEFGSCDRCDAQSSECPNCGSELAPNGKCADCGWGY